MPKGTTESTFRPPWLDETRWTKVRSAKSSAKSTVRSSPATAPRFISWIADRCPRLAAWHSRWKSSLWSSLALHLAACLVLAFIVTRTVDSNESALPAVESRWNEETEESAIEQLEAEAFSAVTIETQTVGGRQQAVNPLAALSPSPDRASQEIEVADVNTEMPSDAWGRSSVFENANEEVGIAGFGVLNLDGNGDGTGAGTGDGDGGFFGINGAGKKHVFVVDASTSMNHPHNSDAKTRFGRLKIELVNTIGRMTEETEFFVIFFNDRAIPMPAPGLIQATRANQMKSLEWVATAKTGGRTDPREALLMALRLNPDIIYFLTDGEFEYRVVKDVAAANRQKTPIYTFCFSDRSGEKFLKQIAAQSAGKYHYVP
ncbi:MAG: vWA domain-containing protein [Planctomycetaceae bacterium]